MTTPTRPPAYFRAAPRLVPRFAVYAGLALLLAALAALLLARFEAQSKADNDLKDDAAYVADELGRDDLARTALATRVSLDDEAQLDEFLGTIAAARDLAAARRALHLDARLAQRRGQRRAEPARADNADAGDAKLARTGVGEAVAGRVHTPAGPLRRPVAAGSPRIPGRVAVAPGP